MLLLAFACQNKDASHQEETETTSKKTFVYCSEGSPSSFNPQLATDGTTFNASSKTIYDRLTAFDYGTTNVIPGLAESWSVSQDGKEITFKLKKGVKFQTTKYFTPTREFNADDVLFSFNRQRLTDHPYHKIGGGSYEYFGAMEMNTLIKDIVKVDDHTVKFVLTRPEAPFLANLAMDFASILSKEYADQLEKSGKKEDIDNYPVGTGPFAYKSYAKDTLIRYTAHPNYFQGKPKIDQLVFAITPDASVRFQKLKTSECHLIAHPSPTDLEAMKADNNIKVLNQPGLNIAYLAFNVEKKPFNDFRVRQAINHALDKESYIKAIYIGQGQVAKNPIPPTMWSYDDSIEDYDLNLEKAKELLKDAGLENGFKAEIWTLPVSRPYNPNGKKMGEMMQADLAKIGIKVKLISYDWPTYLEKSKNGEHQMLQMGWTGDNGDPDNFLNVLLGCAGKEAGSNRARWCNEEFNSVVTQAKTLTNQAERSELYKKAQKIFKKQAPWATLAHSITHSAMRSNVEGFKIDPLGSDYFYFVDFK